MNTFDVTKFSPIGNLRLDTKEDLQAAFEATFDPLVPAFSEGGARVRLEQSGAHFEFAAADLEGFSRPLWGIVPFVAGGGNFKHWDLYHRGLTNGTNPEHGEYWGLPKTRDQRLVELAAIGFALALIPEQFYEPLSDKAKANLVNFLRQGRDSEYNVTNWRYFRVLVDLGLKRIGAEYDHSMTEKYLDEMETYYIDGGFYGDGPPRENMDYYNPWGFHFYGLVYAKLCPEDTVRGEKYRQRAKIFAEQFQHWFADDGACLAFGRSLTYKYCCGSFWGALAYADEELLPWGVVKGLYLRHMRWWTKQPISRLNSGLMSNGWAYPNPYMCENYNSPQSPYWGMKAFTPLALPSSHPFWTAQELPAPSSPATLPIPGMVISHYPKNTVALMSGPSHDPAVVRFQAEKYCKFAYSTRYGFSIDFNTKNFENSTLDSMIGLSEDGKDFRVRDSTKAKILDDKLYSVWSPWKDVTVETWLIPSGKWHIRVHRIKSATRDLTTIEGGFAIARSEPATKAIMYDQDDRSYVINAEDFSGVVDLNSNRTTRVIAPEPNSNIMAPKTLVPQLKGSVFANTETIFAAAFLAQPDVSVKDKDWLNVPILPSVDELEHIKSSARPVLGE
jgi:hypothetical protein